MAGGSYLFHAQRLEVIHGPDLPASSLGSTGYKRWASLRQEVLGVIVGENVAEEEVTLVLEKDGGRPSALRSGRDPAPSGPARRAVIVGEGGDEDDDQRGGDQRKKVRRMAEDAEGGEEVKGRGRVAEALSDLRQKLKESMRGPGKEEEVAAGSKGSRKAAASSLAVAAKKRDGPKNLTFGVEKPATEVQELLKAGLEEPREGTSSSKRTGSPSKALIAAASQAAAKPRH